MSDIPYKLPQLTNIDVFDTIHTILHVHTYDTVYKTIQIDSVLSYKNFQETLSYYSTMFNMALIICTVVIACFTLCSVVKYVLDREKLKNLEKEAEILKIKFKELNNIKVAHSEHIIQLWLNLARFMKAKGDVQFEYIGYMQVLDVLGKDFYKEDLYLVIDSNLTKRLIEIGTYDHKYASESSCLDEVVCLKRLKEYIEKELEEKNEPIKNFVEDLQKLINLRLEQSPSPPKKQKWCIVKQFQKLFKKKK